MVVFLLFLSLVNARGLCVERVNIMRGGVVRSGQLV